MCPKQSDLQLKPRRIFLSSMEFCKDFSWAFFEDNEVVYYYEIVISDECKLFDYRIKSHIGLLSDKIKDQSVIDEIVSEERNYIQLESKSVISAIKQLGFNGHISDEFAVTYCIYNAKEFCKIIKAIVNETD